MRHLRRSFNAAIGRHVAAAALTVTAVAAGSLAASAQSAATLPSVGKSVKVGAGLYEIVASPSTGTIYVAAAGGRGAGGGAVYALNGDNLDVVKTIDMAATPPYGIGINDRTQTVYTTNTRNGSVSAIDAKTGQVKTISSEADKSAHLREIVVDEADNVIYASSYGQMGIVWAIDGRTNELSLIQNVGNGTTGMVLDKAANRLWVSNLTANEVAGIDLKTRQVVERFPAGGERPTNLAIDPKTRRLFVTNQTPGNVTVLDLKAGGKLVATVPTGAGALDVEFNPAANLAYVANRGAGTVTVIEGTSYKVLANLQVGSAPNTISIDGKTGLVYVTSKARPGGGRGRGRGQGDAPATPPPPPVEDLGADTVTVIRP
jgi:YVTN family beta-propeller protein